MKMRRWPAALLLATQLLAPAPCRQADLFSQTASTELNRLFSGRGLEWLLLDNVGRVLAQNWSDADLPVAPGSLLKPFVAVAYGEQHDAVFPHILCTGTNSRCWLKHGHGRIGLEAAIAGSCNTYFLFLASSLDRQQAQSYFDSIGLHNLPSDAGADTLIGLTGLWRVSPLILARAYLSLSSSSTDVTIGRVRAGMRDAAETGTARDVDVALGARAALAKTGTAMCLHPSHAPADGFAVVLFPAAQPRVVLFVRMHGTTGAHAAAQAGAMLRAIGMSAP